MKKDKAIFISGIMVTVLIIISSGFLFYLDNKKIVANNTIQAEKEVQTPAPLKEKTTVSDYKNTEIEVLNATKIAGNAKKYADKLKALGYTKVKTGNYTEETTTNKLLAPSDFSEDLAKIGFEKYEYQQDKSIKIIIGK